MRSCPSRYSYPGCHSESSPLRPKNWRTVRVLGDAATYWTILPVAGNSYGRFLERLSRRDSGGFERHLHLLQRRFVDLRNAALIDTQDAADFLHGHLIGVIQHDHFLIALRQRLHGYTQDAA